VICLFIPFAYLHHLALIIQTLFLSLLCLTCDAEPEPSSHDSWTGARTWMICALCYWLAFSSDVVTLRERYQSNLQLELGSSARKRKGSRVADGREQQLVVGAKAIDGRESGCNEEPVPIIHPSLHFLQVEFQKGHRRDERRVDKSRQNDTTIEGIQFKSQLNELIDQLINHTLMIIILLNLITRFWDNITDGSCTVYRGNKTSLLLPLTKESKSILKQEINFLHYFYSEEHKLNDIKNCYNKKLNCCVRKPSIVLLLF